MFVLCTLSHEKNMVITSQIYYRPVSWKEKKKYNILLLLSLTDLRGGLRKCFLLFKTYKYTNNVLTSEIVNTKFFEVTSN